ncbi:hypothetical protein ACLB2K_031244 [Fragaria x ananassa]
MVGVDIGEPLKKCIGWMGKEFDLEYEHLPFFCLYCGLIDHVGNHCARRELGEQTVPFYSVLLNAERKEEWLREQFKQEKEVSSSGGRMFGLRWVMKAPEFPTVGLVRSREEMDKNERPVLEGDTMEIDGGGGGVKAPTAKRQRPSDSADLMDIPIKEFFYIKEALMAPSNIKEIDSMTDSGEESTAKSIPVLVGNEVGSEDDSNSKSSKNLKKSRGNKEGTADQKMVTRWSKWAQRR